MDTKNVVETDVLIVGGGPSGLATAISLANKFKQKNLNKKIMLIEKGSAIGSHILSGAVIKPAIFKQLLTKEEFDNIPFNTKVEDDKTVKLNEDGSYYELPFHPPYMNNSGNYIASLGEVCRYLANIAQEKGVEIYTGFAVEDAVYENGKIIGVKTKDTGINHHGEKMPNYQEGTTVLANVTVFAEGTRGSVVKKVIKEFNLDDGKNPQIFSLGVKELWEVPDGNIEEGTVLHTFGYPLIDKQEFGGGFVYGLKDNKVAIGLVVGLDYKDPSFDTFKAMQVFKTHPYISKILKGGKIIEAGAKTLPEGGWNSMPKLYGDNFLIVGDSGSMLSTASLKGIHLAVASGICASQSIIKAFEKFDFSERTLSYYEELINDSLVYKDLYLTRNFRAVMQQGMLIGGLKIGVQLLTGGLCLSAPKIEKDSDTTMTIEEFKNSGNKSCAQRFDDKLDNELVIDKATFAYLSKTKHDEEQPVHLVVEDDVILQNSNIAEYGLPCEAFCPAEVYELHVDRQGNKTLRIHAENCVHCKTCDIKAPNGVITWTTPYGGDGPEYNNM